jgi:WhiB family redox-sensing transcriptional regulator
VAGPLFRRAPWVEQALCRGVGPSVFFPGAGRDAAEALRAVCRSCPVRTECLALALSHQPIDDYGWFGGLDPLQRRALRRFGSLYVAPDLLLHRGGRTIVVTDRAVPLLRRGAAREVLASLAVRDEHERLAEALGLPAPAHAVGVVAVTA